MQENEDRLMNEHSSGDESSSSESEHEVDSSFIDRLEIQVRGSPFDLELNQTYVKSLIKFIASKDITRVFDTVQEVSNKFGLSEEVWIDWLKDLESKAKSKEDIDRLKSLYLIAVKEFISVPLWCAYCSYCESVFFNDHISVKSMADGSSDEVRKIRELYEQAIVSCGLHLIEGGKIWSSYRTFEQRILGTLVANSEVGGSAIVEKSKVDPKTKQIQSIRSLYRRQLAIPLATINITYRDYEAWEQSLLPDDADPAAASLSIKSDTGFQRSFNQAKEAVTDRLDIEKAIKQAPTDESSWNKYIDLEMSKDSPARVVVVYERSVKSMPSNAGMWRRYVRYLETQFNTNHQLWLQVHDRATKNCYWSGEVWSDYLRALERAGTSNVVSIGGTFERGMVAGLSSQQEAYHLFTAYIDFTKRSTDIQDPSSCERLRGLMQRAVSYFGESQLGYRIGRYWSILEANIFGNFQAARDIWSWMIKFVGGEYECAMEQIRMECFVFRDYDQARQLFKRGTVAVLDKPEKLWDDWMDFERTFGTLEQWEAARDTVHRLTANLAKRKEKETAKKEKERDKPKNKKSGDDTKPRKEKRSRDDGAQVQTAPTKKPKATVFTIAVTNLPWSMNEDNIKEYFLEKCQSESDQACVAAVRLMKDQSGRSNGMAFIDLTSESAATKAMALSGTELMGRIVTVEKSIGAPPIIHPPLSKRHTDVNTIFIKNLGYKVTESEVQSEFEQYGKVLEVRLLRDPETGRSRGLAYVEFGDAAPVQSALNSNGREIQGRPISVTISKPPKPTSDNNNNNNNNVAKEPVVSSHPKQRLMPRVMQHITKSTPTKPKEPSSETQSTSMPTAKSNADFKRMLLNK